MSKRLFDVVAASILLVLGAPFMLVVALCVRVCLGKPVLFRQVRPGLGSRPFTLLKFRTMTNRRDAAGEPLPDSLRLGGFGSWLRSTSLDELPELLNVIRGQMSLVGPRPLLAEYVCLYTPEQLRRHEVRPGITGWAQVNGRNTISWEEKFRLDVWYVDNRSMWLDLKILVMTIGRIFAAADINQAGSATAQRFKGTER